MSSGQHRHQRLGLVLVAVLACSGAGLLFKGLGLGSGLSVGIPDPLSIPSLATPTSSGGSALGPAHGLGLDGRAPAGAPGQPGMVQPGAEILGTEAPSEIKDVQSDAACPGCDVVLITVSFAPERITWAPTDSSPMSRPPSMHSPREGFATSGPTPHPTSRWRR